MICVCFFVFIQSDRQPLSGRVSQVFHIYIRICCAKWKIIPRVARADVLLLRKRPLGAFVSGTERGADLV